MSIDRWGRIQSREPLSYPCLGTGQLEHVAGETLLKTDAGFIHATRAANGAQILCHYRKAD